MVVEKQCMAASFSQSSGVEELQARPVRQHHRAAAGSELDQALAGELRERARYRLDGEPEMVGDVGAQHRQLEAVVLMHAFGEIEQEGGDLLLGGLAAQQQHMVLRPLEAAD